MILNVLMSAYERFCKARTREALVRYYMSEYPNENRGYIEMIANKQLKGE